MVGQGIFKTNETWMKLQFLSKTTRFLNRYFPVFDRNTSSKIRKYEMEYFSSLQDFFFRENEYLWIFSFHREKIDNICHDWKSRDRSNLRIYWFIWRNKGIICRCQLEDECRYHLRPPFDTRENENFAADSFPLLPFASVDLSSPFLLHKHAC